MVKYSKFLLTSILRKKAPYIILAAFFALFDLSTWVQVKEANKHLHPMLNSLSTFNKFFPFLFATFFIVMIIIYAFKEGENDGTELSIVAKPLTRLQIIFGKFLIVFLFIIAFTLITFLNYYFIAFTDSYLSSKEQINYALSLSIGGGIVITIVASILIIAASFLNKTALLSFGIVTAAIVPILSFILSPIGKGQPFGYDFLNKPRQKINFKNLNKLFQNINSNSINLKNIIDSDSRETIVNSIDPNKIYIYDEAKQGEEYKKYKDEMWYDKAAPLDIWYQWGKFYSMFQEDKPNKSHIINWNKKAITINTNDDFTTEAGKKKYVLFINPIGLANFNKLIPFIPAIANSIIVTAYPWSSASLFERIQTLDKWIKYIDDHNYDKNFIVKDFSIYKKTPFKILQPINVPNTSNGPIQNLKNDVTNKDAFITQPSALVSDSNVSSSAVLMYQILHKTIEDYSKKILHNIFPNINQNIQDLLKKLWERFNLNITPPFDAFVTPSKAFPNGITINKNSDGVKMFTTTTLTTPKLLPTSRMIEVGSKVYIYSPKHFMETNTVLIIWGIIALLSLATAMGLFIRRDFR